MGRQGPWLALFDIDSTLMDTAPRNAAILRQALATLPGLAAWNKRLEPDGRGWNLLEPLKAAGLNDPAVLDAVQGFWRERFFTNEALEHDKPYPGVPGFLRALKAEGFRLVYLTGRDGPGMEKGTRRSFARHGLPDGPEETFLFKPSWEMEDRQFKQAACASVTALGTVVFSLDNEPANANLFRVAFPEALSVWMDTITSPDIEPLAPGVLTVGTGLFLDL